MKKKSILLIITLVIIICLSSTVFAYGTLIYDMDSSYKTWVIMEAIPIWIGTDCASNLFQNYMIAGQYIGFHECSEFAYQVEWGYGYSQVTNAGSARNYYKGSSYIGGTSMPYDGNVFYQENWIWDRHAGNTDGDVIGTGYDTYYAKSSSAFICIDALYPTATISNSVSMTVSQ